MTAPAPDGYRTERLGRVSLAIPEAFGSNATFRARLCAVRDEPWPVPASGTLEARREARERERDALWRQWFAELVAEAARIDPADYDPDTFDPETLSARQRRRLPVMVEERQLGAPDPDGSVGEPDPGARWLRMAAYHPTSIYGFDSVSGRALLDAGTVRLWIDTGAVHELSERMFGWTADLAADYRPGPPAEAPAGAFVLRHGYVVGADDLPGPIAESVSATFRPPDRTLTPFTIISLKAHVASEDPAPADWTLDEGLDATNAMGRAIGVSFEKVREGDREAGGVVGYETVTLGHERGRDPEVVYSWRVQGLRADVLRPSVHVEARSYLSRPGSMTEDETRAVWDRVIDSVCFP